MRLLAKLASFLFAVWFYLLDDILLLVQLRLIDSRVFNTVKWKNLRNFYALGKNVMHFLSSLLEIRYLRRNERRIEETFDKHSDILLTNKTFCGSQSSLGN